MSLLRHFVCDMLSLTTTYSHFAKQNHTVITHKNSHKIPLKHSQTDSLYCLECSFRLRPWDEVLDPNSTVLVVAAHSTVGEDSSPDLYQPQVFIGFNNLELVVCSTQYKHLTIYYISVMVVVY
jgi:hypothetical protein